MNYGYDEYSPNWNDQKKKDLANALSNLCKGYTDKHGMQPYVEVDNLYSGVRIRRITHLTEKQQDELVQKADLIYDETMKGGIDETLTERKKGK